ncbi:MAG TPA: response regulator [Ktedonobacteraceae bacterium]|nr:response regulator [Ktedonobacteraceae bacterium]
MADIDRSSEHAEDKIKIILVVEDNTGVGEFLVEALKMEAHYQALLATDGAQALEMVKTLTPDLFVLDYQLPVMTGLELADRLQTIEALKPIPVLLMSANLPKRELDKRHIAFINKPFELEKLLQAIEKLVAE